MEDVAASATNWANKTFEAWSLYTDASLKITKQLTDFTANAAKEHVSLFAELQTANLEAIQEGQAYVMKRLSELPQDMKNPGDAYKASMDELATSTEKVSKLVQSNSQAVLRSSEQYWLTAQKTGTGIKDTCTQLQEKLTTLYKPA
jgi:hypothetical protein